MNRNPLSFTAIVILLAVQAVALQAADLTEEVVATVDGRVITRTALMRRAALLVGRIDVNLPPEEYERHRTALMIDTLDYLVNEALLELEAEALMKENSAIRSRIDAMVREDIEAQRRKAGGEMAFRMLLRDEGIAFPQYVSEIRRMICRQFAQNAHGVYEVAVSPDKILDYYETHIEAFRQPAAVKFRQISIDKDNYESETEARKTAQEILALTGKGEDFAALARKYSDDPRSEKGGLWDFVERGKLRQALDDLLFGLEPGEVGGPIETTTSFILVVVEERREERSIPLAEAQEDIEQLLREEKRQRKRMNLLLRLERKHFVDRRGLK